MGTSRSPTGPISGLSMPICVGVGVAVWLVLSIVPFAGLAGCWLAGYCRRSDPLRDGLAGAIGVSIAAVLQPPSARSEHPVSRSSRSRWERC